MHYGNPYFDIQLNQFCNRLSEIKNNFSLKLITTFFSSGVISVGNSLMCIVLSLGDCSYCEGNVARLYSSVTCHHNYCPQSVVPTSNQLSSDVLIQDSPQQLTVKLGLFKMKIKSQNTHEWISILHDILICHKLSRHGLIRAIV